MNVITYGKFKDECTSAFLNSDSYKEERNDVKTLVDIAFNDNIYKLKKLSYNKTIDVQIGRYLVAGDHYGAITVNFKPTHGWRDWIINALCFGFKWHHGYISEIRKYSIDLVNEILDIIGDDDKEIIFAGRSKGAAEALMLSKTVVEIVQKKGIQHMLVGAFAPPKSVSKKLGNKIAESVGIANIYTFIHRSDIVPKIFFWFGIVPSYGIMFGNKGENPFKTHHIVTTDRSVYDNLGIY